MVREEYSTQKLNKDQFNKRMIKQKFEGKWRTIRRTGMIDIKEEQLDR